MRIPGIPYVQGGNSYTDGDGLHYGIAIHDTSNTASDEAEASYAEHRSDGVSSHFYVDGDSVIQSLDTDAKAGHAGSSNGNNSAIAFELAGLDSRSRQWWLDNIAWSRLGYVIAYILQHDPDYAGFQVRRASVAEMQANPRVKAFYGHDDMRRAWGGTTHTDPGENFPWDRLFAAVNAALEGDDMDQNEPVTGLFNRGNRVGDVLADVSNERDWWYTAPGGKTNNPPPAGSRADIMFRAAQKLLDAPAAQVDVSALAAALQGPLSQAIGSLVPHEVVVNALQSDAGQAALMSANSNAMASDAGQAALVAAANKAEDS